MTDKSNVAETKKPHRKKCCKGDVLYTEGEGFEPPKDNTCYHMVVVGNVVPCIKVVDVCFYTTEAPNDKILANGIFKVTEAETKLLRVELPMGTVLEGDVATEQDCGC